MKDDTHYPAEERRVGAMMDSPYYIDRRQGLCHVRLKATNECISCVTMTALDLVTEIVRSQALEEFRQMLARKEQ